jgi:hypothetical protein
MIGPSFHGIGRLKFERAPTNPEHLEKGLAERGPPVAPGVAPDSATDLGAHGAPAFEADGGVHGSGSYAQTPRAGPVIEEREQLS